MTDYFNTLETKKLQSPGGFHLLEEQAIAYLSSTIKDQRDEIPGDSEIEKLLFLALVTLINMGACEYNHLSLAKDDAAVERIKANICDWFGGSVDSLIIQPQAIIGRRRVDFLLHAVDFRGKVADWYWRKLIIECDGHEFHERTKEQAAKDRAKDRSATLNGIDCFRFTGAEIWRDPWGCAEEIIRWAIIGWGV